MFYKYALLTPVVMLVILLLLHELSPAIFIQLGALHPQIHAIVTYIHTFVSKWLGTGLSMVNDKKEKGMLFTKEELSKHSEANQGLYLAILGKVYDVGKGEKYYGTGGNYHFFTGRDGSRAFITGDFTESGLTDDVIGLSEQELTSLHEWAQFYHKQYKYLGKVIGKYYDSNGQRTPYNREVKKLINKAKRSKQEVEKQKLAYPPCNAEWSQESGSRVWCTNLSGGIERNWVGVPRQMYTPGSQTYRCACVKESEANGPNMKEYPNCNPQATSCSVQS
ncbi:hypothetical protein ANN_10235 [Periplaneta americana]|uniref:Cytochrome b5 heme-binding domain-containing protein n=2 Tax=Periplaneta americana TaxID=6978 RepID=A0ABQ8TQ18_PERAM|nr:hypothetical protein ANN_10235 [Periplaneta americana]